MLILKSLENDYSYNDDKEICHFFYPDMFDTNAKPGQQLRELKKEYESGRTQLGNDYDFYNLVEKCLLEIDVMSENDKRWQAKLDIKGRIVKEIKGLAMMLSRFKPADWNKFLDVVIK